LVPEIYKDLQGGSLFFAEKLGNIHLGDVLLDSSKNGKIKLAKEALDLLVALHYVLGEKRSPEKILNYSKKIVESFGSILSTSNPSLYGSWKNEDEMDLENRLSVIDEYLNTEKKQPLHGDYHPHNLMMHDGKMHVIDFKNMYQGPWQFDFVRLIKHPSFDLDDKEIRGLFNYFLVNKANLHLEEEFGVREGVIESAREIGKEHRENALRTLYFSNVYNDIKIMGASSELKIKDRERYELIIERDPDYLKKTAWYMKDLARILNERGKIKLSEEESESLDVFNGMCEKYQFFD
tara:strand:+ start:3024 stop:3902 length:879 start_codon:yes stop_codon:yes gene_type:complete